MKHSTHDKNATTTTDCQCDSQPRIQLISGPNGEPIFQYYYAEDRRWMNFPASGVTAQVEGATAACTVTNTMSEDVNFTMTTVIQVSGSLSFQPPDGSTLTIEQVSVNVTKAVGPPVMLTVTWDGQQLTLPAGPVSDGQRLVCSQLTIRNTSGSAAALRVANSIVAGRSCTFDFVPPMLPLPVTLAATDADGNGDPLFTIQSAPPGGCDCDSNNDVSRRSA